MSFLAFYRDLEEQPLHDFICAPLLRSFFPSPHPHFRKHWWGQYQASKYWTWRKSSCLLCFGLLPWQTSAGNIPVSANKDITINTTIQMLNPNLDFMILFGTHSCGFQIRKASVHCVMTSQFVVKLCTIRESIRYSFFGISAQDIEVTYIKRRGSRGDKPQKLYRNNLSILSIGFQSYG